MARSGYRVRLVILSRRSRGAPSAETAQDSEGTPDARVWPTPPWDSTRGAKLEILRWRLQLRLCCSGGSRLREAKRSSTRPDLQKAQVRLPEEQDGPHEQQDRLHEEQDRLHEQQVRLPEEQDGLAKKRDVLLKQQDVLQKSRMVCPNCRMVCKKAERSAQTAEWPAKRQSGLPKQQNGLQKDRMLCKKAGSLPKGVHCLSG